MPHAIPRPWTESDVKKMRELAQKGLSSRLAAIKLRRTRGAVAFKAMTLGIHFSAIKQPAGVQKRLARVRRKASKTATLRAAA
jgi:hypothetical protein